MKLILDNYECDTLKAFCAGHYSLKILDHGRIVWQRNARTVAELLHNTGLSRTDFHHGRRIVKIFCGRFEQAWRHIRCYPFKDQATESDWAWCLLGESTRTLTKHR